MELNMLTDCVEVVPSVGPVFACDGWESEVVDSDFNSGAVSGVFESSLLHRRQFGILNRRQDYSRHFHNRFLQIDP